MILQLVGSRMRIRIKTRVVIAYLIAVCCGTIFFGVYFLSVPQLPSAKSRNGIERAARDSWSEVQHHERNSPLRFKGELQKPGIFWSLHKEKDKRKEQVIKEEHGPEQRHVTAQPDGQILIPPKAQLLSMSWEELAALYHSYTRLVQIQCSSIERVGKVTDGGWEVCEDNGYRPSAPCLVYSFGVGDDFSFDDAVAKRYGCEVHSFDPSMKSKDHQRSSSVYFHALGLANYSGVTSQGWNMSTLPEIQHTLGHQQRELAVLKLDIEEWEWKVLPSLVKGGHLRQTRQLLVELHQCDGCSRYNPDQLDKEPPRERYLLALGILADLYDLGFRIFWQHQNRACSYLSKFGWTERSACCELHFVRVI
ncbi:uncharacterized protein LOC143290386 [Babylonia areolata]|uniref:uncharacterized protein LOC143290386 n=1 Tax=Babylonia areolata TaxID=304850 RepID=UPI003FD2CCE7